MKRFLLTTALVAFTAGSAVAQDETQLRTAVANEFSTMGLNVDANALSTDQLSSIYLLINSDDMGKRQKIEAALSDMGIMDDEMVPMEVSNTQLRTSVQNAFDEMGIDGDANALSDAEVSELYLMVNSSDMGSATESRIQEALSTMQPGSTDSSQEKMVTVQMPKSQLSVAVANELQAMGSDVDVNTLSQAQLGQIYLLVNGSHDSDIKAQIDAIVN